MLADDRYALARFLIKDAVLNTLHHKVDISADDRFCFYHFGLLVLAKSYQLSDQDSIVNNRAKDEALF
jgi:hypothetical protein